MYSQPRLFIVAFGLASNLYLDSGNGIFVPSIESENCPNPVDNSALNTSTTIKPGEWVHIASTIDSKRQIVQSFVNGTSYSTVQCTSPVVISWESVQSFSLFENTQLNDGSQSEIDELRVWPYVRTQEQIRQSMNRKLTEFEAMQTMIYFNFDSPISESAKFNNLGKVTTLVDDSPENRNIVMGVDSVLSSSQRVPRWRWSGAFVPSTAPLFSPLLVVSIGIYADALYARQPLALNDSIADTRKSQTQLVITSIPKSMSFVTLQTASGSANGTTLDKEIDVVVDATSDVYMMFNELIEDDFSYYLVDTVSGLVSPPATIHIKILFKRKPTAGGG
ncbi:hypothetical protein HK096_010533, partial [Nowakowskiella sp. JEL0078]